MQYEFSDMEIQNIALAVKQQMQRTERPPVDMSLASEAHVEWVALYEKILNQGGK